MLTNVQIEDLARRMQVPLEFCDFKNNLPKKIKTNRAYIINMMTTMTKTQVHTAKEHTGPVSK
jgi:PII-like signaling protein